MKPTQLGARRAVAFVGYRDDGRVQVLRLYADGTASPLPPRFDLRKQSPDGFEWGYRGSGPAQLALAILAELFDDETARDLYQDFKTAVVSNFRAATWSLLAADVAAWLDLWRSYELADRPDLGAIVEGGGR